MKTLDTPLTPFKTTDEAIEIQSHRFRRLRQTDALREMLWDVHIKPSQRKIKKNIETPLQTIVRHHHPLHAMIIVSEIVAPPKSLQ